MLINYLKKSTKNARYPQQDKNKHLVDGFSSQGIRYLDEIVKQTVVLAMIWDAMVLVWRHSNVYPHPAEWCQLS